MGDEPLLLARVAPTWVAADRPAGAAAAADAGAAVAVMDDGHQNASIEKACSIVVIDGAYGFGNGRLLPAGPLREPVADGLARADAAIVIGPDEAGIERDLPDRIPLLRGGLVPRPDSADIAGARVVAFAGIARPEKFFRTLSAIGCRIEAAKGFADHHRFDEAEISRLVDAANAADAIPVTTAKDAVRLPPAYRTRSGCSTFRWNGRTRTPRKPSSTGSGTGRGSQGGPDRAYPVRLEPLPRFFPTSWSAEADHPRVFTAPETKNKSWMVGLRRP